MSDITPNELARLFPNASASCLKVNSEGAGARPIIQKRKNAIPRQADNRSEEAKVDGEGRSLYRITITLLVSDRRARDGDGAVSTILDTYLFALGRLASMDRNALRKLATSEQRRRRL